MVPASPPVAEGAAAEGKVEQSIDRKYHNEQNPAGHIAPAQSTEHQGLLTGIGIEFRGIAVRRGGKDVEKPMSGDILPAAFLIDADLFLRQAVIRVQEAQIRQLHPVAHGCRLPAAEPGEPGAPLLQEPPLCRHFRIKLFGFPDGKFHRMQCVPPFHLSSSSSMFPSCTMVLSRRYSSSSACVPASVMA